jgi:RNA polymerase sigma-70 factor, ECF subfamily
MTRARQRGPVTDPAPARERTPLPSWTGPPISTVVAADDHTVARAKNGDHAAWRELYVAHAGRLVVWLRTLPSGDAGFSPEDVAAETWLTAASKIADFRGTSSDFAGWLFGIARHQARNAERRTSRRRTAPASIEMLDQRTGAAPAAGESTDAEGWVSWLLSHLPRRERQVVACLDVVGLDVASTAAALGMSASAVRVAHHRALKKLRSLDPALSC